jgi:predicted phosphodiesterase
LTLSFYERFLNEKYILHKAVGAMKPLSISILSDLHIDSYFPLSAEPISEIAVRKVFEPIFKTKADVLVIAGDLGHYNHQAHQIMKWLRALYFKNIICVLGNHDYYLVNRIMMDDFNENSFERVSVLRTELNAIEGVYCLDGNVVEIEGVRFGGCDSWYDGQYWLSNLNTHYLYCDHHIQEHWKLTMPDASAIKGIKKYDDIWKIEQPKIEAVYQACDVMITHVMPSIDPQHVDSIYRKDKGSAFFTFNGEKYLKETTAKVWVYGHNHTNQDVEVQGVRLVANQMGYRGEARKGQIVEKVIEIYPEMRKEK